MIITPNTFSNIATPVAGIGSWRPVHPCSNLWRRLILAHLEQAASRLDVGPDTPLGDEGARERRIREIEHRRVAQHPAHS